MTNISTAARCRDVPVRRVSETWDRSSPVPTECHFCGNIGRSSPADTWPVS